MNKFLSIAIPLALTACDLDMEGADGEWDPSVFSSDGQENLVITPTVLDPCRLADPDHIIYVPSNAAPQHAPSGSGAYGYKQKLCNRWVVDFKMATYSGERELTGGPWDLPGSADNGTIPVTKQDCTRLATYVNFYRKKANETSFTKLGSFKYVGLWSNGVCKMHKQWGTANKWLYASPSQTGWDTYRVAVGTKLRSSWQEVRAASRPYIQPPK